jgi:hypothetical protein
MQKLFNSKKLELYLKEGSRHVDGYLQSGSASVICSILDIQDELKISGNIAEIGVFHGKLLILLCHGLREGETVFAIDVFNTQPDIQGIKTEADNNKFSPDHLLSNLDANKINSENIKLVTSNSQNLFGSDLIKEFGGANIRLFSIDGDHSRDGVRHDLNLAAATMAEGGVILADDLFNTICPSLTEGIIDFFREDNEGRLEPIAIVAANGPVNSGSNKLNISDPESAMRYKAFLQLLNRTNYSHSDRFLGFSHVLIFDFKEMPTRHLLDDDIRNAVTKFFDRKI